MANPPERSGPGQSGSAAGQQYFDERAAGAMQYPIDRVPQGSRSTLPDQTPAEPKPAIRDDELREMIVAALRDDASGIAIDVAGGAVTLSGAIGDDDAKRRVEDTTRRVPGVKTVINQLGAAR
jgi:osmotically-inducible protein OsmY